MDKIFLDTNVILDHALDRLDGEPEQATEILSLAEGFVIETCISQGSLYTLAYVLRKALGKEKSDKALGGYLSILNIVSISNNGANQAIQSGATDTEDAFQYQSAKENGCIFFITRNIKDFRKMETNKLPILTPDEYLRAFFDFRIT
jgi:predicted nucleic acid-binding protein